MVWLSGGLGRLPRRLDPALRLGGAAHLGARRLARRHVRPGALPPRHPSSWAWGRSPLASSRCPLYVRRAGWGRQEWFLLAWIVPPAAFYTLVHFGQAGYVLTFLPALVILLSRVLVEVVGGGSERLRRPNWRWALTAAALVPLVPRQHRLLRQRPSAAARVRPPRGRSLDLAGPRRDPRLDHEPHRGRPARARGGDPHLRRDHPRRLRSRRTPRCSPSSAIPRSYPWLRHAMFYLPEYAIYQVQLGDVPLGFYAPQSAATMILTPGSTIALPRRVRQLVWFVDHWDPAVPRPAGAARDPAAVRPLPLRAADRSRPRRARRLHVRPRPTR